MCVPGLTFTASLVACFKAGLVGVPVYPPDPTRASKELVHFTTIQQDCGAKVALTDSTYSSARTLGAVKSFFTFGKKEYVWPDLKWITVDTILKAGKSANLPPRHNPPAELAFLQYTSGSTSAPKGVMVTAQNLAANYFHYSQVRDMRNKKIVTWLPQYHDMGLIGCYLQWVHTGSTGYFFSPISFIRDPLCWIRLIGRYQPEVTAAPNFAYALVVRKLKEAKPEVLKEIRSLDLSSLRIIYSGAEPINIAVVQEFLATFAPMGMPASAYSPCYGLAEHTLLAGGGYGKGLLLVDKTALENGKVEIKLALEDFRQPFEHIEGTVPFVACGRTDYEGNAMISVDPVSCEVCPEDRVGELWLNSDSKAQGYYNRPEATQDTFRARLLGGGTAEQRRMEWLRSGDLVIIHKNEFFFCGRHKDLIVLNGRNYYPQDVERTAEGCHRALRPGCSAAFAVQQGHGADQTEGVILIAEVSFKRYIAQIIITYYMPF